MVLLSETQIKRLGLAGLIASFALLIAILIFALWGFSANQRASDLVNHTYEVKDAVSDLTRDIERATATHHGFLLDPSPYREQTFVESSEQLIPGLDRAKRLVADDPNQINRLDSLRPLVVSYMDDMKEDFANPSRALSNFNAQENRETLARVRALTEQIDVEEDVLLTSRLASERRAIFRVQALLALAGFGLLIASIGTIFLLRRQARDLFVSRARLNVLNTNLESAVAERTADLKRANEEISRFAYIVSHDLRSPLVNVMGFTAELETADKILITFVERVEEAKPELVDDKVRFAAREDLPEAIGFIRSSTQKMDRLINAILNLSRQGRRELNAEHLSMEKVVGEIIDSLATTAEERGATITIERPLPGISHDRVAIDQLFQNLIENATKYLKPGQPGEVVVRGRRSGNRAIFEIEDNGRGIAAQDHERIFELFRRSGSQDQSGEGIGLAHVRALAYRLGGNVTVTSALNAGATFTVDLPVAFQAESG